MGPARGGGSLGDVGYAHTQRGGLHWLLLGTALLCALCAFWLRGQGWPAWLLLVAAVVVTALAFCFTTLTVRDEGEALGVRFGPLPLFHQRVPYASIRSVEASRSRLVDGLGVHWVPGRGWTWNLWGFDCVLLDVQGKTMRIGTDDRENLVAFLEERLTAPDA